MMAWPPAHAPPTSPARHPRPSHIGTLAPMDLRKMGTGNQIRTGSVGLSTISSNPPGAPQKPSALTLNASLAIVWTDRARDVGPMSGRMGGCETFKDAAGG